MMTTRAERKPQAANGNAPEDPPSFTIIERPNELKIKAGSGGLPPGALEKAQVAVMGMKDDCLAEVKRHLTKIEAVLEKERAGNHDVLRRELSTLAAQVYAFCGSCGLTIIGDIAKSLDRLAVKKGLMSEEDLALIEPHLSTLTFAVTEFSKVEGSEEQCKILLNELEEAVAARLN